MNKIDFGKNSDRIPSEKKLELVEDIQKLLDNTVINILPDTYNDIIKIENINLTIKIGDHLFSCDVPLKDHPDISRIIQ